MIDLPTPPVQYAAAAPALPTETIYIVADSANLFSGAQMIDGKRNMDIKVNLATTLPLIDDGRPIKQRVVVASFPERSNRMWRYFEQRRYQIYYKTEETDVDEELYEQIRLILCQASEPRRCLVLVTGDGNAHKGQHNFPQLLTHALQHGWNVEIVCWRDCVNPVYETLRNDYPTQMRIRHLDNHRDEITFLKPRITSSSESGGDKQHGGHHHHHHHHHAHHPHYSRPFAGGYPMMSMGGMAGSSAGGHGRSGGGGAGSSSPMGGLLEPSSTLAASSKAFYPRGGPSVHATVTGYPQHSVVAPSGSNNNNMREMMAEARSAHPNKYEDGSSAAVESLSGSIDLLSLGSKTWSAGHHTGTSPQRAGGYGTRPPPGLGLRAPTDSRTWSGAMGGSVGLAGTGYHSSWSEATVFSPTVGGQTTMGGRDTTRAPPMTAFQQPMMQQPQPVVIPQQQHQPLDGGAKPWSSFDGWRAPTFFTGSVLVEATTGDRHRSPLHEGDDDGLLLPLSPEPHDASSSCSPACSSTASPALALSPTSTGSSSPAVLPMCSNLSLSPQPEVGASFARSRSIESDIGLSQCLEGRV